jgi:hypothetical protein
VRLTVGSLPAAVYWRRRAVVLVGLAMVVLVVSYACNGPDAPAATNPSSSPTPASTPSPTPSLQRPTIETSSPTTPAFTLPVPANTGACGDTELELTASATTATVSQGSTVDVTIKIKNISSRACSRDVGADMQELRLLNNDALVWSSDDCGANHGSNVKSFGAGKDMSFTLTWNGRRSRAAAGSVNCQSGAVDATTYQLVARLDKKLSPPFALRVQ